MFSSSKSWSQSWQWGVRGGSPNSVPSGIPNEKVLDLATDQNGNIYFLAHARSPVYDVADVSLSGHGYQDLLLGSFSCSGNLRWIKTLGGANDDVSNGIYHSLRLDQAGHVYVGGFMSNAPVFSTDTVLEATAKRLFLVQYDTTGAFQWLRMPQSDTVTHTSTNRSRFLDMDVDAQGNVYYYGTFNEGSLSGTSTLLPVPGPYILRYDVQGNLTDVITLEMQVPFGTNISSRMARDHSNGDLIVAGQYNNGSFSINGQPINTGVYIAAFDADGQFLWKKENSTTINAGFAGRPVLDGAGNIYVGGTSSHGDVFDGFPIINTISAVQTRLPFLVKINANGTTGWVRNASVNAATYGNSVALIGDEVLFAGSFGTTLIWPDEDTLQQAMNEGYDIFVGHFDAQTGALNGMERIASAFGGQDHSSALAADGDGNFYVGGEFGSQLYVGPDTLLSHGGQTDFFIAKYGSENCDIATSNDDDTGMGSVRIYPNPTLDHITVHGVLNQCPYRLYSLTGKIVKQGGLSERNSHISLSGLAAGIYVLELSSKEGEIRKRVVKE